MRRGLPPLVAHTCSALVLVALAACSGGGGEAAENTSTVVTTVTAEATIPPRDGSEVCAALDQAEVEEVLGASLIEPPRIDTLAPTCALLATDGIVYARLMSEETETPAAAEARFTEEAARMVEFGAEAATLEDLGDQAELMALADGTDLVLVRVGPVVFNVAGDGIEAEKLVALAELLAMGLDG